MESILYILFHHGRMISTFAFEPLGKKYSRLNSKLFSHINSNRFHDGCLKLVKNSFLIKDGVDKWRSFTILVSPFPCLKYIFQREAAD